MKNYFKTFILSLLFTAGAAFSTQAQIQLGAHGIFALPTGDLEDQAENGAGGGLSARYGFNGAISLGLTVDYISLGDASNGLVDYSSSMLPVVLDIRYTVSPDNFVKPYGSFGVGYYTQFVEVNGVDNNESGLGLRPKVGFQLALGENFGLDFGTGYNIVFGDELDAHYVEATGGIYINLNND